MKCPFCIKICTKCKRLLVANGMNFNKGKGKYGLTVECKECWRKRINLSYKIDKKLKNSGNPFDNMDINKVWNHCPFCIKVCTKCGKILIANNNNFARYKKGKYGLVSRCKICDKNYRKEHENEILKYRKEHREEHREYCEKHRKERQEYYQEYYKENKDKIDEYNKQWYEGHKEEIAEKRKEYSKQYYKEHKEERNEYNKQWYKENKEEIAEKRKEYRENNPHIFFNIHNKRRLLEENQGDGISKEQWYEMMMFFDFRCAYSGEYIGDKSSYRTIDHIIPLANNGEHAIWNCVPMYANYNYSKGTNNMEDWYMKQEFFDIDRLLKIYDWIEYAHKKWK